MCVLYSQLEICRRRQVQRDLSHACLLLGTVWKSLDVSDVPCLPWLIVSDEYACYKADNKMPWHAFPIVKFICGRNSDNEDIADQGNCCRKSTWQLWWARRYSGCTRTPCWLDSFFGWMCDKMQWAKNDVSLCSHVWIHYRTVFFNDCSRHTFPMHRVQIFVCICRRNSDSTKFPSPGDGAYLLVLVFRRFFWSRAYQLHTRSQASHDTKVQVLVLTVLGTCTCYWHECNSTVVCCVLLIWHLYANILLHVQVVQA